MDLCFVPEQHEAQDKLPAVSGSSGHLVVEHLATVEEPATWPGQVFTETDLAYAEAMQQYVQATQNRQNHSRTPRDLQSEAPSLWRQASEGRAERYQVLQRRKQEDADWRTAKVSFRQFRLAYRQLPKVERDQHKEVFQAEKATWNRLREQRRTQLQERKQENQAWHQGNQMLKADGAFDPQPRSWIAILVVTDNCTRQCLGLPVFRTGAKVTSSEVIAALKLILPAELQFLISDQGKHFHTKHMALLAQEKDFAHVLVYRHRPESNGIAERFVLTLKKWLQSLSWQSVEELEKWVRLFQPVYNDRPHQGLGIPGLSPNEFAKRIWLM